MNLTNYLYGKWAQGEGPRPLRLPVPRFNNERHHRVPRECSRSREILAITGITINENDIPGNGARFEITVPKSAYRFGKRG